MNERAGETADAPVPRPKIDGSFVPCVRADIASVEIDGERVIYDQSTRAVVHLDAVASVVWLVLDGSGTIDELAVDLADAFGADVDQVKPDVLALVERLAVAGVLEGTAGEHHARPEPEGPAFLVDPPSP